MNTRDFVEFCTREEARLKWYAEAREVAEGLLAIKKDGEKATRERDEAIKARDAAVADLTAKQVKYEAEMTAALADVARVTKAKADAAALEQTQARATLAQLHNQIDKTNELAELAVAQLDALREDADREAAEITARVASLRAEERAIKERFAAALK